ncbi:MAG: membrane-bound lytic murein transglycosylase MltF [Gammaproteobacteria bacterium]|nr:membrane-bound lytic murein transglycosylase MltF [Gammaproteobacteria bacterium]
MSRRKIRKHKVRPVTPAKRRHKISKNIWIAVGCVIFILFCYFVYKVNRSELNRIKDRGTLVILTRNTPTTYYENTDGETGFEYDLAKLFANDLHVDLKVVVPNSFSDLIPTLRGGGGNLIAAGMTITATRAQKVEFGPAYQEITQQLIYNTDGDNKPREINDILNSKIEVIAGSSFEERLIELKKEYPALKWTAIKDIDLDELLVRVSTGAIDYTIADSNEFNIQRRLYQNLNVGFNISAPQQLAWAFRENVDPALLKAAQKFFARITTDGTLTQLMERHYGHNGDFDIVETTTFLHHINERLPTYQSYFKIGAARHELDWRLLAALSYQESHWRTEAISPTGVRGIMMLTHATAGHLGIANRLDAEASILGGAQYLKTLKDKMPTRINEPDRTWLALAAYNVGYGHLEDARILTETLKKNPDQWIDVKESLPLLSQQKWHQRTKHGYARGREPVIYVQNIRGYYEVLLWLDERNKSKRWDGNQSPIGKTADLPLAF